MYTQTNIYTHTNPYKAHGQDSNSAPGQLLMGTNTNRTDRDVSGAKIQLFVYNDLLSKSNKLWLFFACLLEAAFHVAQASLLIPLTLPPKC